MPRLIYVVHSEDAQSWATFIKNLFLKQRGSSSKYEVRSVLVKDLARQSDASSARPEVEEAEVLVTVLSPEHLHYLESHAEFTYNGLAHGGQKGVLFFCGTSVGDLEGTQTGGKDLRARFPSYKDWAAVQHTDANSLMRILDKIQPIPSLVFQLIPDRVRCENGSTVTVSFSEIIAFKPSDLQMSLYISNDDGTAEENVDVTWANDKTVFFKAPERKEGPAKVRVLVKGSQIPGTSNLYYESSCELISDMMQLYIHAMDHLFTLVLSKSLMSNRDLDAFLFKIFSEDEPKGIQPKAFEELFGIYRYNSGMKGHAELPTLLHFASKFGFVKFQSWLENLPDATLASKVQNCEGLQADKVNKFKTATSASSSVSPCRTPFQLPTDDYLSEDLEEDYLDMDIAAKILAENREKAECVNIVPRDILPILRSGKLEKDPDQEDLQTYRESFDDTYDTYTPDLSLCDPRPTSISEEEETFPQIPPIQDRKQSVVQCGVTTDPGQQKLIEIMTQVKRGELSMEEANILFEEWKIQHKPSQKPPPPIFMTRGKQSANEMTGPSKPSVSSKDAKSSPALPPDHPLPPRLGRRRVSDGSDKTSSTASSSSFDSSLSSATSSIFSHSSGIDIDLIDEDVHSHRSSGGSIDGSTMAPPIPARDARSFPSKCTTLPRTMPGTNKVEGPNVKGNKR